MDTHLYIKLGSLFNVVQSIPESQASDTVSVSIRRLSDAKTWNFSALEFQVGDNSGSMTFIDDIDWKCSFTPPSADTYVVRIYNETLDVKYRQVLIAVGSPAQAGMTGSELTTLENLRSFLKKKASDTQDDTLLESIITSVSSEIEKRCNRVLNASDYTEYFAGNGLNSKYLKHWPINSIASIHIDEERQWSSDTQIDSDDIIISSENPGLVILDNAQVFDKPFDLIENVKVVYNAGYSTIPSDLELDCMIICSCRYRLAGGMVNTLQKGQSDPSDIEDAAFKRIISNYRKFSA